MFNDYISSSRIRASMQDMLSREYDVLFHEAERLARECPCPKARHEAFSNINMRMSVINDRMEALA